MGSLPAPRAERRGASRRADGVPSRICRGAAAGLLLWCAQQGWGDQTASAHALQARCGWAAGIRRAASALTHEISRSHVCVCLAPDEAACSHGSSKRWSLASHRKRIHGTGRRAGRAHGGVRPPWPRGAACFIDRECAHARGRLSCLRSQRCLVRSHMKSAGATYALACLRAPDRAGLVDRGSHPPRPTANATMAPDAARGGRTAPLRHCRRTAPRVSSQGSALTRATAWSASYCCLLPLACCLP